LALISCMDCNRQLAINGVQTAVDQSDVIDGQQGLKLPSWLSKSSGTRPGTRRLQAK
jgi:hypothetical protein